MSIFCVVDDKHIPLYRILWVAAVPHFCGHEDCTQEGNYEIRLEQGESVWASREERDTVDRKSTRLNSSHVSISYAVFCLKKKNTRCYNIKIKKCCKCNTKLLIWSVSFDP